jgi:hypothetical protein
LVIWLEGLCFAWASETVTERRIVVKRVRMTTIERILELKRSDRPFWLHLSDGKELEVRGGDWVGVHPSGKGSHVTVYGPEEEEECGIPVASIVRVWARETE